MLRMMRMIGIVKRMTMTRRKRMMRMMTRTMRTQNPSAVFLGNVGYEDGQAKFPCLNGFCPTVPHFPFGFFVHCTPWVTVAWLL